MLSWQSVFEVVQIDRGFAVEHHGLAVRTVGRTFDDRTGLRAVTLDECFVSRPHREYVDSPVLDNFVVEERLRDRGTREKGTREHRRKQPQG